MARRVVSALTAASGAARTAAGSYAYPGMGYAPEEDRRSPWLTGSFSLLLHLGVLGFLFLMAALAPRLDENLIPVQILRDTPAEPDTPAPAPKVLAERRLPNFSPQVQSVAPQIVNPRVVASAAPSVSAKTLDMDSVSAVRAPTAIDYQSLAVERVARVNSVATARAAAVDVPRVVGPAVRGPVKVDAPAGPSVGPRRVALAQPVDSIGTGTLAIGSGSSVREGIASSRDVLGSPVGQILVDVDTVVGEGHLRGTGGTGNGTGLPGEVSLATCTQRPAVQAYITQIRNRTFERWRLPPGTRDSKVTLRFRLDAAGSASGVELIRAEDNSLGASAVDAMRAASPFPPMPEDVRCLAQRSIIATFTSESGAGSS